jgi:hypothetical protein
MLHVISAVLGYVMLFAGIFICIYWQMRFLVVTYRCSPWWFFGCLFVPFVDLAFVVFNFKIARKSYGLSLLGLILFGLGSLIAGVW